MLPLEPAARSVLEQVPKVSSAWLFGSWAVGRAQADSDIDIGVLLKSPLTTDELINLSAALSWELRVDIVDLVVLNTASPTLAFEAISGTKLLCLDPGYQAEFFSLTCRLYEDDMAMLERGFRYRRMAS